MMQNKDKRKYKNYYYIKYKVLYKNKILYIYITDGNRHTNDSIRRNVCNSKSSPIK